MLVDAALLFSDAQVVTNTAASSSYLDLGAARKLGVGEPLYIVIVVDAAPDDSVVVALEGDTTTTFSPDGTKNILTIADNTAAGTVFVVPFPFDEVDYRYNQLKYTPGNTLGAGAFTAFITKNPQAYASYADAITIS